MATKQEKRKRAHQRRKKHIRKVVYGTAQRPRLVVNRTLKHITASLVDDDEGKTLTGIIDAKLGETDFPLNPPEEKTADDAEDGGEKKKKEKKAKGPQYKGKTANAYRVGMAIASMAKERGIESVVFDRNGFRYHGRVKALADGARKGGLKF